MRPITAFAYFAIVALGGAHLLFWVAGLVSTQTCDWWILAGLAAAMVAAVEDSGEQIKRAYEDATGTEPAAKERHDAA